MLADTGKASPAAGLRYDRGIFVTELVLHWYQLFSLCIDDRILIRMYFLALSLPS